MIRRFPIAIGLNEAFAIERRMGGDIPPRPQTHDLLASVIATLGATLQRIEIHDLDNGTFHARLVLDHQGDVVLIASRPSAALAVGVAEGTPVMVEEKVIEMASASSGLSSEGDYDPDIQVDQSFDEELDDDEAGFE